MKNRHNYSFSEENNLLTLEFVGDLFIENAVEFLTVVVSHRVFPDDILILQNHSQANFKLTLTDIHLLEAFQRKYIDNYNSVRLAIIAPTNEESLTFSKYYQSIINNKNCTTSLQKNKKEALAWLNEGTITQ